MAAGLPPPVVRVVASGHACRALQHEVDLSAHQTGRSRVEEARPASGHFLKGRFHARCQTLSNGGFVHLLVLSSDAQHGPRIGRTHRVPVRKLKLSASTTTTLRTAMCSERC